MDEPYLLASCGIFSGGMFRNGANGRMEKVAKNGRKVKTIALLFCCFLPIYEKWKKSLKMDEKLRL